MRIFSNIFKKTKQTITEEQAVVIHFQYGFKDLTPLQDLEDKLNSAFEIAKVGEYDGNEIAVDLSDGSLYFYGPSAEDIFSVISPIIQATPFLNDASVKLRYGPPVVGVKEKIIKVIQ